jgi:DNA (cytosine-5)-methyltransferase 1
MKPTFGSLFAGVGGFDLGFEAAGYKCKFQVEWDKHCQQILAHHWPNVPRWGDVSEVSGYDLPPVDVITYGFPCQDLSVAGRRAGLDGERSNLFFEAVRIIKEMREATNGLYPTFAVAENVVGLLNADKGDAMARVLDTLAETGAVGIEWCTLDAQWLGVPQRRRRVFVTACFDPATLNRCPNPLFPIAESGARNPTEILKERETAAGTTGSSIGSSSQVIPMQDGTKFQSQNGIGVGEPGAPMYTLTSIEDHAVAIPETFRMLGFGHYQQDENASAIKARDHKDNTDLVAFTKGRRAQTTEDAETWDENRPAPTLNIFDQGDTRTTVAIVDTNPIAFDSTFGGQSNTFENISPPVKVGSGIGVPSPPAIAFTAQRVGEAPRVYENTSPALLSRMGTGGNNTPMIAEQTLAVRRLTPTECERLMGWPDGHTLHRADGTENSDSQRYKQCGNGVVAPVAQWIAKHLKAVL